MLTVRRFWPILAWSMAVSAAFLAAPSTASAKAGPDCASWASVSGWKGNYTLTAKGTGMVGPATVTVSYSSSADLHLTRPGPTPCPAAQLEWAAPMDAANAKGAASYRITAACKHGGTATEYFSTSEVGPNSFADLKIDLSKGSLAFVPLLLSAPVNVTQIDCKGGSTTVPLATVPFTPVVPSILPLFELPAKAQGVSIKDRTFQVFDSLSSLALTWTLSFDLTPDCDIPDGEITSPNGWYTTLHQWKQTLTSSTGASFAGLRVTEIDAGGGVDSCWYPGSSVAPVTTLSGGTWTVNPDNTWGDDDVGWGAFLVIYYHLAGTLPCGFTLHQQMQITCYDGSKHDYGPVNTLKGIIGKNTVGSERAGHVETRRLF